jgi:PAS domain S-box-containing protein
MSESRFLRYGVALMLPVAAVSVILVRPTFTVAPFFLFLGAVVLSAANGGLAAGFVSTALSALLLRLVFLRKEESLQSGSDLEGIERMGVFVLVALLLSSVVAAIRRERNQLRDSEERYRILAETASDAIIVIDEQGEILYVNPVAEKLFGTESGQLLGKNLNCLLPGDGYQAQLCEMKHRLDTRKKPVAVQLPGLHHSGAHLLIEMTLGGSSHRGKSVFTAIIRDITGHTDKPRLGAGPKTASGIRLPFPPLLGVRTDVSSNPVAPLEIDDLARLRVSTFERCGWSLTQPRSGGAGARPSGGFNPGTHGATTVSTLREYRSAFIR